jgi:hypothetical protein
MRISLSVRRRGRSIAKAMTSATSSAVIAVSSYIFSVTCLVCASVMWSVSSVATAPGSMIITRTSGWSAWRSASDQPLSPHLVAL